MTRRVNLNRWQPHVEEARRRRGVSLKAYAAEQGLSLYSLCRASQVLHQGGAAEPTGSPEGKFATVRVVAAPTIAGVVARCRASAQRCLSARGCAWQRCGGRHRRLGDAAVFRLNEDLAEWLHRDAIDFRKNATAWRRWCSRRSVSIRSPARSTSSPTGSGSRRFVR